MKLALKQEWMVSLAELLGLDARNTLRLYKVTKNHQTYVSIVIRCMEVQFGCEVVSQFPGDSLS